MNSAHTIQMISWPTIAIIVGIFGYIVRDLFTIKYALITYENGPIYRNKSLEN